MEALRKARVPADTHSCSSALLEITCPAGCPSRRWPSLVRSARAWPPGSHEPSGLLDQHCPARPLGRNHPHPSGCRPQHLVGARRHLHRVGHLPHDRHRWCLQRSRLAVVDTGRWCRPLRSALGVSRGGWPGCRGGPLRVARLPASGCGDGSPPAPLCEHRHHVLRLDSHAARSPAQVKRAHGEAVAPRRGGQRCGAPARAGGRSAGHHRSGCTARGTYGLAARIRGAPSVVPRDQRRCRSGRSSIR